MCTLWLITVAAVLVAMLPSFTTYTMRKCDLEACKKKGKSSCFLMECKTDGIRSPNQDCGGTTCNRTTDVCIGGTCLNRRKHCKITNKDGQFVLCRDQGEQCGEGQFCIRNLGSKCVNSTCRDKRGCVGEEDGTICGPTSKGRCSGGVCLEKCAKNKAYAGSDEYCADPKCGESVCF